MQDDEFVYAFILDQVSSEERFDKILQKENGKSYLQLAIEAAVDSKPDTGIDLIIVLSSSDSVLDAASELGAIARMVPGFFDVDSMIKTYVTDSGVMVDPNDDPIIIVIEPYTMDIGLPRALSEITGY